MSIPIQFRFTILYGLLLGVALLGSGYFVSLQAAQTAYQGLDDSLRSRAESIRFGKALGCYGSGFVDNQTLPALLPGVNGLSSGVSIQVFDAQLHLLASTTSNGSDPLQAMISSSDAPVERVPWDGPAAREVLASSGSVDGHFSTVAYQGQSVRVYTLLNNECQLPHVIQTARSEKEIEQTLMNQNKLLWGGGALVLVLALLGGWLITQGVLRAVQRITHTAQQISATGAFSQRVPVRSTRLDRDELALLAATFNAMLTRLEELYQRQSRFIADASHELRAPITSIRCNLDLLAHAPDLPAHEIQDALCDARAEADRMGRLVNDLLALARSDEQRQKLTSSPIPASAKSTQIEDTPSEDDQNFEPKLIDLDSLLLEVFRQYQPGHMDETGKLTSPRLILRDITPARVAGDHDQLKQVLIALVDNALKYTPNSGSVSLALTTTSTMACFSIADTGSGIAPADLPHIFERFYRADRARSRDQGGSGLGLAIAQSIVERHGGKIEVTSEPERGSIFLVTLPLTQV